MIFYQLRCVQQLADLGVQVPVQLADEHFVHSLQQYESRTLVHITAPLVAWQDLLQSRASQ